MLSFTSTLICTLQYDVYFTVEEMNAQCIKLNAHYIELNAFTLKNYISNIFLKVKKLLNLYLRFLRYIKCLLKFYVESGLKSDKTGFRLSEVQVSFQDQWQSDQWPAISASTVSAKNHKCQDDSVVVWMSSGVITNLTRNNKVGRLNINDPENNEDFFTFHNNIDYCVNGRMSGKPKLITWR